MANVILCEPEARYRKLLRYILEGVHHRVSEIEGYEGLPGLIASERADLLILGAHLEDRTGPFADPVWQKALPGVPLLLLLSGPPEARTAFLEAWHGPPTFKFLGQPVEPYPLLAMVKSMVTAPEIWRRGGQHAV